MKHFVFHPCRQREQCFKLLDNTSLTRSQAAADHASFHIVTAILGSGVSALPYAFALLTWIGGPMVLIVAAAVALYTTHQLVNMHIYEGERFSTYQRIASISFGRRRSHVAVWPFQLVVILGTGIAYIIIVGTLIQQVVLSLTGESGPRLMAWALGYCSDSASFYSRLEVVQLL